MYEACRIQQVTAVLGVHGDGFFLRFVILGVALEFSFAACSQVQTDATEQYPLMYSEAGFINLLVRLVCPR